jgi:5-methylcytosine-specific restriction endonuclease McrA
MTRAMYHACEAVGRDGEAGESKTDTVGRTASWQQAHQALVRLAKARAGLDFDEGERLLEALRVRTHERLGFGSFVEYVGRLFGYAPRLTHDKLRVAEALEELPELRKALREGQASWCCVRELSRVATRETEHAWLEAARGRTVREVERCVSGHQRGSLPSDPSAPQAEQHVLRFEVSGEVLATFREAMAQIRRAAGGPLDDDAALLLMARHVLGGPTDVGRASYQIELTVCEKCQRGKQGRGEPVDVSADVVEMARCDGQRLGDAHVGASVSNDVAAATTCVAGPRAKQDVPPALRRTVLRRDQHRCQVPGCFHVTFVDVHHIETREDGGAHEADNLVTLCSAHHRAGHRGELVVRGRVSTGLSFRHADGTEYGGVVSAPAAGVQAGAFQALRRLGFGEGETRRALAEVLTHMGNEPNLERVLRSALERLSAHKISRAS